AEHPSRVRLADGDVARREVGQDDGARERSEVARWSRSPEVFTQLDVHHESLDVVGREQKIDTEGSDLAGDGDRGVRNAAAGSEPSLLVKLAVVGQKGLRDHTEHAAAM